MLINRIEYIYCTDSVLQRADENIQRLTNQMTAAIVDEQNRQVEPNVPRRRNGGGNAHDPARQPINRQQEPH